MSQILYTEEITSYLRNMLYDNLHSTLGLKVCQVGDISYYESNEALMKLKPLILIRPSGGVDVKLRTTNFKYDISYKFRILYITQYIEYQAVVTQKMRDVTRIVDLFFDNTTLRNMPALDNCKIVHCLPTLVEYDPPEDGYLALLGGQLISGAVNIEVLTANGAS